MTKDLKKAYEDAEANAQKIMAERDEAMAKVRERFDDRLRKANADAADAQKRFMDAEVIQSLLDRPDGEAVARSLREQGSLDAETVASAFPGLTE